MPNQFTLSQSRLLNLPGEIRNTIWEMVLGNQTLHFSDFDGFSLTECVSHITEEKANQMADAEHPDKEFYGKDTESSKRWAPATNEELLLRHAECDLAPNPSVAFDLLRVCRQMYRLASCINLPG